jgi:mannose-6-phosphate isomerase-like protein (cupin superfamily)
MRYHADDRGQRYCDIFPEGMKGDINITIVEPGAAALWHRHKYQADYQIVVKGSLKIGICNMPNTYDPVNEEQEDEINNWVHTYYDIYKNSLYNIEKTKAPLLFEKHTERCDWFYLSERNANEGPLFIPTGLWHGCYNYTNEPAILAYYITTKWNGTDEDRSHPDIMNWDYKRIVK